MIFIRASTLRTLIETSQSGTAEASGDAQTYTDLATAQQIAAVVPATDIGTSRDAFKEALDAGTTLARIAVEVWATHFGTVPMDGWPDRHTPDFRCAPGAMSRFRPGVADSVITAAEAAGPFGLPGILTTETSGNGKDVMVRFFTVDPDGGGDHRRYRLDLARDHDPGEHDRSVGRVGDPLPDPPPGRESRQGPGVPAVTTTPSRTDPTETGTLPPGPRSQGSADSANNPGTTTTAYERPRIGPNGWRMIGRAEGSGSCDHCNRPLKHRYRVTNPTGAELIVGRGCLKTLTGWTKAAAEAERIAWLAERLKLRAANWQAFTANHPQIAARIDAEANSDTSPYAELASCTRLNISEGDVEGWELEYAKRCLANIP